MNLNILAGILLIAAGAFSSGSFAVPFGRIKGWKWETCWMVYSIGAYVLVPLAACLVFAPDTATIIRSAPASTVTAVFLLGALYGVGNLSFGLALRYMGLSLGYALSLRLMLAIGTLIPPLLDRRLQAMMQDSGGNLLILGVVVACAGIAMSAWSGLLKDRQVPDEGKKQSVGEYDLVKGILAALLWFSQFILYGMGRSKMGPFTFTSWGILMALTIVSATLWGLLKREWKGTSLKVYVLMILSLLIIIASSFMIGISGSL